MEEQQGKIEELKSQNTRQEEQLLKNQEALLELSSQVQMHHCIELKRFSRDLPVTWILLHAT